MHEILDNDKQWSKLTADRKALLARRAELAANIERSRARYDTVAREAVAAGELAPPPPPFMDAQATMSGDFAALDRRERDYAAEHQARLESAIDERGAVLSTAAVELVAKLQAIADEANLLTDTSRRIGTLAARQVRASDEIDVDEIIDRVRSGRPVLDSIAEPATADAWNPFDGSHEYVRLGASA